MNENTAITIVVSVMMLTVMGGLMMSAKYNNEVRIACYEAAKTNLSIKCN